MNVLLVTASLTLIVSPTTARRSTSNDYDYNENGGGGDISERAGSGYGGGSDVDLLAPLVLLAPLAGLAALYTAAAVNSNSALLTIAVVNTGKRRRRSSTSRILTSSPEKKFFEDRRINVTDVFNRMHYDHFVAEGLDNEPGFQLIGCEMAKVEDKQLADLLVANVIGNPLIEDLFKESFMQGWNTGHHRHACGNLELAQHVFPVGE